MQLNVCKVFDTKPLGTLAIMGKIDTLFGNFQLSLS